MGVSIGNFLEGVVVGEPQESENLLLFPLFLKVEPKGSVPYLLLDEALAQGTLKIGEVGQEGSVNTVLVSNSGEKPVLILDGEELLGAKQNRMVNATCLIPAKEKLAVPVSCVERGRWRYETPDFHRSGAFGYSTLRQQKAAQVASSLACGRSFAADQGAIWAEIDRKQAQMGIRSETDALHDVFREYESKLEGLVAKFEFLPEQVGVMSFINGVFSCLDLFSYPATLRGVWTKLVRSYALEALERAKEWGGRGGLPGPEQVLAAVKEAEICTYPAVGRGTDIRLRGANIIGAGLVDEDLLLHLSVFGVRERDGVPMARPSRRKNRFKFN